MSGSNGNNREIYIMNSDGPERIRLTNNKAYDGSTSFSPDGYNIAFTSNRDVNFEIYIMNADDSKQLPPHMTQQINS